MIFFDNNISAAIVPGLFCHYQLYYRIKNRSLMLWKEMDQEKIWGLSTMRLSFTGFIP